MNVRLLPQPWKGKICRLQLMLAILAWWDRTWSRATCLRKWSNRGCLEARIKSSDSASVYINTIDYNVIGDNSIPFSSFIVSFVSDCFCNSKRSCNVVLRKVTCTYHFNRNRRSQQLPQTLNQPSVQFRQHTLILSQATVIVECMESQVVSDKDFSLNHSLVSKKSTKHRWYYDMPW